MSYQVVVVAIVYDPLKLDDLLAAWEDAGVSGVTVLYSTGMGRLRTGKGLRDDIPLLPSLEDFYPDPETVGRTVFSVCDDESVVQALIEATRQILGDLNTPQTGLLVVVPAVYVEGIIKNTPSGHPGL
jgi:nitrogen regulatory protein P-II 1